MNFELLLRLFYLLVSLQIGLIGHIQKIFMWSFVLILKLPYFYKKDNLNIRKIMKFTNKLK